MPTKSSSSESPVSAPRRSSRNKGEPASAAANNTSASKKRVADEAAPKSGSASKKTKTVSTKDTKDTKDSKATRSTKDVASKAKATPKSGAKGTTKSKGSAIDGESKAEAAKEASPEDKAVEEEKEAEASPEAEEVDEGNILGLGDKLPKITLQDEESKDVDVSKIAGKKGVVLFLYPKADTPGCTAQACGFRDAFDDISKLDYEIYGLSRDGPNAQKKWKDKKTLNYKLLCDPQSVLIKRLGAFVQPKNTKRSHFIFEKGSGKLVDAKIGVKPADDPSNCLKFIKSHHK